VNPLRPTRREAEREAYEEWLENTWEERFERWCLSLSLDPQDNTNVHAYEEEWEQGFTE
jgi:hypothetical protein